MSDLYSDEYQEPEQQAAPQPPQADPGGIEYWKAEAQKAFQARDAARQELRTHIQSGYDPEVVELVPPSLAPKEWKDYADKLVAFRGQTAAPVTPETSSEEPPPEVDVPAETLSGIVNGPSGSATSGTFEVSRADWLKLSATDPMEAQRLFQAGKVDLSGLRDGLGPDR